MGDVVRNATGTRIDPVDGMPVFAVVDGEPMSRRRWLDTAGERRPKQAEKFAALADKHRPTEQEK